MGNGDCICIRFARTPADCFVGPSRQLLQARCLSSVNCMQAKPNPCPLFRIRPSMQSSDALMARTKSSQLEYLAAAAAATPRIYIFLCARGTESTREPLCLLDYAKPYLRWKATAWTPLAQHGPFFTCSSFWGSPTPPRWGWGNSRRSSTASMCSSSGGECYGTAILTYLYPLLTLDTLQATGADDFVIPPDDPIWETLNGIEPTAIEPFDSTLPNNQGIQALNACASEALYHHQLYLSSVPDISLLSSSPPGPLTSLASAAGPAMAPDLSMASTATLGRSLVVARPPARQSQPPARRLKPSPKQELATRRDFSADSAEYAIMMIRRGLRGR